MNNRTYNKKLAHNGASRKKKSKKHIKIVNKRRFAFFCTLCIIFTTVLCGIKSATASRYSDTYTITVASGDTLWDIARENNPAGRDVRKIVDDIIRLNHMTDTSLYSGDKLIIPLY